MHMRFPEVGKRLRSPEDVLIAAFGLFRGSLREFIFVNGLGAAKSDRGAPFDYFQGSLV